jgi:hypothetical protein
VQASRSFQSLDVPNGTPLLQALWILSRRSVSQAYFRKISLSSFNIWIMATLFTGTALLELVNFRGVQMKRILIALGLLCFTLSANAATLHYSGSGTSFVTAIENLEIGGVLYNVDFDTGTYGTFGGDDEFWTTAAETSAGVDAINTLFDANGVYGVNNYGMPDCLSSPCYTVMSGPNTGTLSYAFGNWINAGTGGLGSEFDPIATAWSVAVPIPAAVWLFGSALMGLGWLRRK